MNYFSRFKYAIWTIILLIVIILTAVASGLYFKHKMHHTRDESERRAMIDHMFKKELDLTDEQEVDFKKIHQSFFDSTRPIFEKLETERIAMLRELSRIHPDTTILYQISDSMGLWHARLKRETVNHLLLLRNQCTPAQVQKLNLLNSRLISHEGPMRRMHSHNFESH